MPLRKCDAQRKKQGDAKIDEGEGGEGIGQAP